jgi:hypothetical protein
VVTTRAPRETKLPWRIEQPQPVHAAEPRYVPAPKRPSTELPRPQFGAEAGPERSRSPLPPPYGERKRLPEPAAPPVAVRERREVREQATAPQVEKTPQAEPAVPQVRAREPQPEIGREQKPTRVAPPEAATAPRQERERVQPRVQEPGEIRQREGAPRVAPQESRQQDRVERVERTERSERAGLPGDPANRTYRGRAQDQGDRRRSERPDR